MAPLIRETGLPAVVNGVQVIEFFPYKSTRFRGSRVILSSQLYTFWLTRQALKSAEAVIIFRARRRWVEAVPELDQRKNVFRLNSPQT